MICVCLKIDGAYDYLEMELISVLSTTPFPYIPFKVNSEEESLRGGNVVRLCLDCPDLIAAIRGGHVGNRNCDFSGHR